ncbi:MAG: hypothetical protein ACOC4F_02550 [bacterium]
MTTSRGRGLLRWRRNHRVRSTAGATDVESVALALCMDDAAVENDGVGSTPAGTPSVADTFAGISISTK